MLGLWQAMVHAGLCYRAHGVQNERTSEHVPSAFLTYLVVLICSKPQRCMWGRWGSSVPSPPVSPLPPLPACCTSLIQPQICHFHSGPGPVQGAPQWAQCAPVTALCMRCLKVLSSPPLSLVGKGGRVVDLASSCAVWFFLGPPTCQGRFCLICGPSVDLSFAMNPPL